MLLMSILFLAAAQQADTGEWGFEFDGKECLLGRIDKQGGMIFAESGDGNMRFFTRGHSPERLWKDYTIELVFEGKSMGTFTAVGEMLGADYGSGYIAYLPLARFADKARTGGGEMRLDGRTIAAFPLKGLKTAIAELARCNKEVVAEKAKQAK